MERETFAGYLSKRAVRNGRTWKRRFFVLLESALTYYKTEGEAR